MRKILVASVCILLLATAGTAYADFINVDTSFGAQTALRDNSTQLDWLHLNLTTSISYTDMQQDLQPGGILYGWRYATSSELTQLLIDYDDSPSGGVLYNDALAIQFMHDLGGPTYTADNFNTGFHREAATAMLDTPWDLGHALYGYIAIDNFSGATVDPRLQGSAVDWFANPNAGHWLVRDSAVQIPEPTSSLLLKPGLFIAMFFAKRRSLKVRCLLAHHSFPAEQFFQ